MISGPRCALHSFASGFHARERGFHLGEALRRVRLPGLDLADDAQRLAAAVGLGRVAGEAFVGEIGIVLERARRLDDVDALAALAPGQLAAPDRRVERAREGDPRLLAVGVVGGVAGREQVVRREVGARAVVEGAGGVDGVGHGLPPDKLALERNATNSAKVSLWPKTH